MNINNFAVRFVIDGVVSDVSAALTDSYLPAFSGVADPEAQLLSALETLAEDLTDGGAKVDFSMRRA